MFGLAFNNNDDLHDYHDCSHHDNDNERSANNDCIVHYGPNHHHSSRYDEHHNHGAGNDHNVGARIDVNNGCDDDVNNIDSNNVNNIHNSSHHDGYRNDDHDDCGRNFRDNHRPDDDIHVSCHGANDRFQSRRIRHPVGNDDYSFIAAGRASDGSRRLRSINAFAHLVVSVRRDRHFWHRNTSGYSLDRR